MTSLQRANTPRSGIPAYHAIDVLVVDDDLDTCEILASVLTRGGYSVETAANGLEAIDVLFRGTPRVLLIDIEMPVMTGPELRQIQRQDPHWVQIPTIVMTGSKHEPQLDLAVKHTLHKPFKAHTLLALVARYCSPTTAP